MWEHANQVGDRLYSFRIESGSPGHNGKTCAVTANRSSDADVNSYPRKKIEHSSNLDLSGAQYVWA